MPFFFIEYYDKRKKKDYHHNMWSENRESAIKTVKRTVGNEEIKILSEEGETPRERLYKLWITYFGISTQDLLFPYWLSNESIKNLMILLLQNGYKRMSADALTNAIATIRSIPDTKEVNKNRLKKEEVFLDALASVIDTISDEDDKKEKKKEKKGEVKLKKV